VARKLSVLTIIPAAPKLPTAEARGPRVAWPRSKSPRLSA
jgi:hypothetical protein